LIFKGFTTDANPFAYIALVLCFLLYMAIAIVDFVWLFGPQKRRLLDYWAGTFVVNEAA